MVFESLEVAIPHPPSFFPFISLAIYNALKTHRFLTAWRKVSLWFYCAMFFLNFFFSKTEIFLIFMDMLPIFLAYTNIFRTTQKNSKDFETN